MRVLVFVVAAIVLATGTLQAGDGMERFRWANRPLVVIAPDADNDGLRRQRDIADANEAGFRERAVVVISVPGEGPVRVDGEPAPDLTASALRARFDVGRDAFRALLVGKDGTVKLARPEPIPAAVLFRTIDAMPMRQREMREQEE